MPMYYLVAELFLVIPDDINKRLEAYKKTKGYDKRQPIIIQAIVEFLDKNGL